MKEKINEDTITAIATPNGSGAISVIRLSGSNSFTAADKIFSGKIKLAGARTHTLHYGKIFSAQGELIDDVVIAVFRNPASYTGEDSIEISTHGNPFITQKIITELLNHQVRLALPGEFTKRAFLNGKLDLAQAEAVADIISSRTEASLHGARNQLDGVLSAMIDLLRTQLLNCSSMVELELDFAEEEVEFLSKQELITRVNVVLEEIYRLIASFSYGRIIRDGVNVAIVGKPNVGKSSLLNYLLKESRAIVSAIPGTTRDVIREELSIEGILFRLFDTAGIRLTQDEVEQEGVLRSRNAVKEADLVLFINDVQSGFDEDLYNEICTITETEKIITVFNKIDLNKNFTQPAAAYISSKTGEGIEGLLHLLKVSSAGASGYTEKSAVVTTLRHYDALSKAKQHLLTTLETLQNNMSGEFVSVDLRNAIASLSEIIGEVTSEDILNNIFSKFCIGK